VNYHHTHHYTPTCAFALMAIHQVIWVSQITLFINIISLLHQGGELQEDTVGWY